MRASLAYGWICEVQPLLRSPLPAGLYCTLLSPLPVLSLCGRSGCEANETETDYRYLGPCGLRGGDGRDAVSNETPTACRVRTSGSRGRRPRTDGKTMRVAVTAMVPGHRSCHHGPHQPPSNNKRPRTKTLRSL
jgi:hypothetical protein